MGNRNLLRSLLSHWCWLESHHLRQFVRFSKKKATKGFMQLFSSNIAPWDLFFQDALICTVLVADLGFTNHKIKQWAQFSQPISSHNQSIQANTKPFLMNKPALLVLPKDKRMQICHTIISNWNEKCQGSDPRPKTWHGLIVIHHE